MNRSLTVALLAAACATQLYAAEDDGKKGDEAAIAAKAKELTEGKASSAEKVAAVHAFVRDNIKQIKAKYG